jgi:hypothetical protein
VFELSISIEPTGRSFQAVLVGGGARVRMTRCFTCQEALVYALGYLEQEVNRGERSRFPFPMEAAKV